jgi:hypothetical protein
VNRKRLTIGLIVADADRVYLGVERLYALEQR